MGVRDNIDYTDSSVIKRIYDCAMEVFGHGIAVPSDKHPCGWDWIDFDPILEDIQDYEFELGDISEGVYDEHEFNGLTLKEILVKTNGKFLFEINRYVDWERENEG